jgi:hypothetical protein
MDEAKTWSDLQRARQISVCIPANAHDRGTFRLTHNRRRSPVRYPFAYPEHGASG